MNPGSRSGRGRRHWAGWKQRLTQAGVDFECALTRSAEHAGERAARADGFDTVVAVGGDGTISRVLDGIVQSGRTDLRMGVLYAGTSPDFCRFHGLPVNPELAVDALLSGSSALIDVVEIRYRGDDGTERLSHFGCGCNIGLGAEVARFSNRVRRVLGDAMGTGLAAVRAVFTRSPLDLCITIDGQSRTVTRCHHLAVLKSPYIASGLKLNLDLKPDDGSLRVAALCGHTRLGLLAELPGFYSGRAVESEHLWVRPGRRVTVEARTRAEVEFDGDPRGYLPAELAVLPSRLDLIGAGP